MLYAAFFIKYTACIILVNNILHTVYISIIVGCYSLFIEKILYMVNSLIFDEMFRVTIECFQEMAKILKLLIHTFVRSFLLRPLEIGSVHRIITTREERS
jgi:hypothetical protein